MDFAPDRQPWDQQPGEDGYWYSQFDVYLRMGPARSLLGAYKRSEREGKRQGSEKKGKVGSNGAPLTWMNARERYQWNKRCAAWDAMHIEEERARERQERRRDRRARIRAAKNLRSKAVELMKREEFSKLFFSDVATALKISASELRTEFGEDGGGETAGGKSGPVAPAFNITLNVDLSQYPKPAVTVSAAEDPRT